MSSLFTRHPVATAVLSIALYLLVLGVVWPGLNAPRHGDEGHFTRTIQRMAASPELETMRSYAEMSTPLPFVLYAAWGSFWGSMDMPVLRLFSLLVAGFTLWVCFVFIRQVTQKPLLALAGMWWFMVLPYTAGLSLYVYTDMPAMLFLLLALLAMQRKHWLWATLWVALALLCRQYLAFIPAAVALAALPGLRQGQLRPLWMGLSVLPLLALFVWWGGAAPDSPLRVNYLTYGLQFRPEAILLCVSLVPLLVLPAWIMLWRQVFSRPRVWVFCLLLAQLYWLFPVEATPITRDEGVYTVGILDKLLVNLPAVLRHTYYVGAVALGLRLLWLVCRPNTHASMTHNTYVWAVVLFFFTMAFSYLIWEKYALPLVPLLLVLAYGHLPISTHNAHAKLVQTGGRV